MKNLQNSVYDVFELHGNFQHTNFEMEKVGRDRDENLQVSGTFYLFKKIENDIYNKC